MSNSEIMMLIGVIAVVFIALNTCITPSMIDVKEELVGGDFV